MKWKAIIKKAISSVEVEAYGFAYVRNRKLILDILLSAFLLYPIIFGLKSFSSYVFLSAAATISLFRLEQTLFELVRERRKKREKELTGSAAIKEAKKILKK